MTLLASRSELAKELGISKSTFARYRRMGIIPKPIAGTQRYVRDSVLAALKGTGAERPESQPIMSPLDEWRARRGY